MDASILEKVSFDIVLWRKILDTVSKEVGDKFSIDIQTISPFGFEILMNSSFLKSNLRRFYAYIGTNSALSFDYHELLHVFRSTLMQYLSMYYENFHDDIVIVVEAEKMDFLREKNYICQTTDKLIDLQFRFCNDTILSDYADYVIASLNGLIVDKGENRGYKHDIRHRWRYYQLYIMQENLYKNYLPSMTEHQQKCYSELFKIVGNMIQIFYNQELKKVEINDFEQCLFDDLIIPRLGIIRDSIKSKTGDNIIISSTAYHFNDLLSVEIAKDIYREKSAMIMQTYYDFAKLS